MEKIKNTDSVLAVIGRHLHIKKLFHVIVFRLVLFLFLLMLNIGALSAQNTSLTKKSDNVFRAGASMSNITPTLGMPIVGNWNSPPASYIHDELYAKSLVLDDGAQKLVIVLVDNVAVHREVFDAAKAVVQNRTGIPTTNMLMAATHTHSGVSARGEGRRSGGWHYGEPLDEYQIFLVNRIADGIQTAIGNLEPAKIAWGKVDVPDHVFNRRWMMKNPVIGPLGMKDKAKMNPGVGNPELVEPAGPIDPEVSFVAVESLEGRPISVLGNYSLHYVGGVPDGHISADYFAIFGERMQELLNADRQVPPFVGIMSNGTSGNINNINFAGPKESNEPYEKMRFVANDVAKKVFNKYSELKFQESITLGAGQTELMLKVRRPTPELMANLEKIRNSPDGAEPIFHPLEKTYLSRIDQLEAEWPDEIGVLLQVFKIGNLGIAAVPFETFSETGLEIKTKSPFAQTFTIELANGAYGYLPTPEQHELGGYETWLGTNRVEVNATQKIMDGLMGLFDTLK